MHVIGVFNSEGGTFRGMDMQAFSAHAEEVFVRHGHTLDARVVAGAELIGALEQAAADPACDALLAGGGDGTISAAAEISYRTGTLLAVLPAGTMNLFARSLGIPLVLDEALEALAAGEPRKVDIATANGETFVHQYSVGIHARLVRMRESLEYRSRWGKILASLRAILRAVRRPPVFQVSVRSATGLNRLRATGVTVTNNVLAEGHIPHADALDGGVLAVYVVKPTSPWALGRLCLDVLRGRWKHSREVTEEKVSAVALEFPRLKAGAQALIDGELTPLQGRIDLRVHPMGLSVVVPSKAKPALAA